MIGGISLLDVKLGLRILVKYPALTVIGGLGMAVAIAISVGFFAFMYAHIYPTLPLDEGERIVALENRDIQANNEDRRALHDYVTWREELTTIDDLGAFRTMDRNLITGEGPPELVHVAEMTASGFRVARTPPLVGRYLVEEDEREGSPAVVVIGQEVWENRFGADPGIVGREIRLGGTVHTVVGVMPEEFGFPMSHSYWVPLRENPSAYERREGPAIYVFGRLAPGVTMEEAQAELSAIGRRTAAEHPETHAQLRPMVMPYTHSLTDVQGITLWEVSQMQFMMSLLLMVVALNVAVLIYARTATRQGEIAVRSALGASRRRVVAQLFVEALVLSSAAAVVGLLLAQFGVSRGNLIMEQELGVPFWSDDGLRGVTVLYTVGITIVAAVIVGVLPALQATGKRLQADLRQLGGGTGMRLGKTWTALVITQVAIAVGGLPVAVNLGWSEIRQATTRPTFPSEEFAVAWLGPEGPAAADRFGAGLSEVLRRLEAEPGVAGVTYQSGLSGRGGLIEVEGVPAPAESPSGHSVQTGGLGPDYLEVFDARVVAGRGLERRDHREGSSAVVVNQAFVRKVLGGGSAVGRRVRHVSPEERAGAAEIPPAQWFEIVGVVEDLQVNRMDPDLVPAQLSYPVSVDQVTSATIAVRTRGADPAALGPRIRAIAAAVDPAMRLGSVRTLADSDRQEQIAMQLVALIIGLVLLTVFLLSAAGIYALMSFTVTQRRREIGIRSALGAQPRQVLNSVFARAAVQVGLGVAAGLGIAILLEVLSGGELLGGRGAVLLPAFAVMMAVVGLLSALGPARRGLRIQPTEALRAGG